MDPHEDDAIAGSTSMSGSRPTDSSDNDGTPIDPDVVSSTTTSIASSVWRFEEENGRTYHGYRPGVYYYPNDPSESVRLDYQSRVLDFAFDGKLHMAPLNSPFSILDVGTGTGAWAIQMADLYPNSKIEATDLSPIQPTEVPENVTFIIDDAEEDDWALNENYYDYIHTRILMGCFEDFKSIIQKGFRYTKPGGWMESLDIMMPPFCDDGTMPADWPFKEWSETMEDAAKNANRPLRIANRLKRWYIEVGFVDVQERVVKLPINAWPRDPRLKLLGKYWAENMLAGLQGFSLALFSRVFGWSKTEIDDYLDKVRNAITDHRVHAYSKVYTVWGRKPDLPERYNLNPVPTFSSLSYETRENSSSPFTPEDRTVPTLPNIPTSPSLSRPQPAEDLGST
ncbi:S-adenosyl-L-methionine-dependent methyltransferase [Stipitochalara longipes BDJ]|nr:S-adenosyl-L-methionine-dependent methyltransferase [Stipitochalara longipes BDJ]